MRQFACPSCGASVPFRLESSVYAVCGACRSLLIRHDVDLEALGKVADLQPDPTLIQLGTTGVLEGQAFEVVGRIQVRHPSGLWNEWALRYADGRDGWLGEAMGEYLVTSLEGSSSPPVFEALEVGVKLAIQGQRFHVTQKGEAEVISYEGELPFVWDQGYRLPYADLRSADARAGTLDYSEGSPLLFLGRFQEFDDLHLQGLRPEEDPEEAVRSSAAVRGLKCPACGASHELHGPLRSQVLVCSYCDTALDLAHPGLKVLWRAEQEASWVELKVPLGARGRLEGSLWTCLGFQERAVKVEGVTYRWGEYLLYDRARGYRFLSESQGHWTLSRILQGLPSGVPDEVLSPVEEGSLPPHEVRLAARPYRHFQTAEATVTYVVGEFPWRVRAGDRAWLSDYVDPPRLLSCEVTPEEVVWSLGTYLEPREVEEAFDLPALPAPIGVGPNQPNPVRSRSSRAWRDLALALGLALAVLSWASLLAQGEAYQGSFTWVVGRGEPAVITPPFSLGGRPGNVRVDLEADLTNRWLWFELALIHQESGRAYNFSHELSFYQGRDSDGTWTEGSRSGGVVVGGVPSGTYALRIEPAQTGQGEAVGSGTPEGLVLGYRARVSRNVPRWEGFWWGLLGVGLYPLYLSFKSGAFEQARWRESDHPPVTDSSE